MRRSRIVQTLNVPNEILGGRKRWRGFSARQDPLQGRTAHTKCGLYLLGPSLAAALLDELFEHLAGIFSSLPQTRRPLNFHHATIVFPQPATESSFRHTVMTG
jgi:hypothetical protein